MHAWDRVPARLWNLKDDPYGRVDLIAQHPEIADRLGKKIAAWHPEVP